MDWQPVWMQPKLPVEVGSVPYASRPTTGKERKKILQTRIHVENPLSFRLYERLKGLDRNRQDSMGCSATHVLNLTKHHVLFHA